MSWSERFFESLDRNLGRVFAWLERELVGFAEFISSPDTWSWVAIGIGAILLLILFVKISDAGDRR